MDTYSKIFEDFKLRLEAIGPAKNIPFGIEIDRIKLFKAPNKLIKPRKPESLPLKAGAVSKIFSK